ncbi:MAG: hypothetical protein PHF24_02975 [Syntrophomonas sp.]|nr:hypothetical protein [Syntrophomonas sp.]
MKNPRYYPHERNRYFYGKLLTVRDFEAEQKYCNDKRRMGNRLLNGAGVVCGLQVIAVDDKTISVETGMALDYSGREIIVASPVTQKLSMIDGFGNSDHARNIYLCIAYDERGKEPVYSVASSSTSSEEAGEHNRVQETFRLFIREDAPDPDKFGFSKLYESTALIYSDEQLSIWQKCPRYVNPDDLFDITLRVEKNMQVPRVQIEYDLGGEFIYGDGGQPGGRIYFQEPEHDRQSSYEVNFSFRAGAAAGMVDNVIMQQGRIRVQLGERILEPESDCSHVLQIVADPVRDCILKDYLELSLDQYLEKEDQFIYLARISIMQIGPSFMIENVAQLPFKEYAHNMSDLYKLGVLGKGKSQGVYQTSAAAYFTESDQQPRLEVRYQPDINQFNFDLGIPRPQIVAGADSTGVAEFELEVSPKAAKSYISDEIDHGLGAGAVQIITGVEQRTDEEVMMAAQHSEQIFFGKYEVFQDSEYESLAPPMDIGAVLYPERGTFRIGIRCQSPHAAKVKIRWWVYKKA